MDYTVAILIVFVVILKIAFCYCCFHYRSRRGNRFPTHRFFSAPRSTEASQGYDSGLSIISRESIGHADDRISYPEFSMDPPSYDQAMSSSQTGKPPSYTQAVKLTAEQTVASASGNRNQAYET